MDILKLFIIFVFVMFLSSKKQPIYISITLGTIVTWIFYGISVTEGLSAIGTSITSWDTLSIIVVMYIITVIQKMMGKHGAIEKAQKGLQSLFHNRWVNCAVAPIFIGMLPTPNAAFIAGDIVKEASDGYLSHEEMAVATSYFRHVSESFMPTYTTILLILSLTGIPAGEFVVAMLPVVACIIGSGCFWCLRGKLPMNTEAKGSENKISDVKDILVGLWPILAIIILVVALKTEVYIAAGIVLFIYFLADRFSWSELGNSMKESVQIKLYLNTFAVMILKEFLTISGAIHALPDFFAALPIPEFLVFVLIMFFGTMVSGTQAIIALCLPVAMGTVPQAGLPLVVLLMTVAYAANQITPTHVCLPIVAEYFGITLGRLFRKTFPAVLSTIGFAILYYLIWTGI